MIYAIFIGLMAIVLFSAGFGLDADVVFGVVIALGVISLLAYAVWSEYNSPKKAKIREKIKKVSRILIPIIILVVVIGIIMGLVGAFDSSSPDAQYDNAMGGYDYGDNYYYDSNENAVKEKL